MFAARGLTLLCLLSAPGCAPDEGQGPPDCAGVPGGTNEAPVADFIQPGEGATFEPGEAVHFLVAVSDGQDGPGDLTVRLEGTIDGEIPTPAPRAEDGVVEFDFTGLSEGIQALTVTVTDSGGCQGQDDRAVQVCAGEDCV